MKLWRKTMRGSVVSAQKSAAPIVFARPRPIAPPINAPNRSVTSADRSRDSIQMITRPSPAPMARFDTGSGLNGRVNIAAYVTARMNSPRTSKNHSMKDSRYEPEVYDTAWVRDSSLDFARDDPEPVEGSRFALRYSRGSLFAGCGSRFPVAIRESRVA